MKILHYINNLGSGGAEKLLTDILPEFKRKGHRVYLLIANSDKNFEKYEQLLRLENIEVHELNTSFNNPLQVYKLVMFIKRNKIDLVHGHLFPTQYWLAFASFFTSRSVVIIKTEHNAHNTRRDYKVLSLLEKFIYSRYDMVVSITQKVQDNLKKWIGNSCPITMINNGVNLAQIKQEIEKGTSLDLDLANYNILMVGSFDGRQKDQLSLIKALKYLPSNVRIYLAGKGPALEDLKLTTDKLGFSSQVVFLGLRSDIYALMNSVNLNVLSTKHEGLSGVTLEALASGKPFIGSDVEGVQEIVPSNNFLFPPQNVKELANKILQLINDPTIGLKMVEHSLTHVKEYDTSKMVSRYLELYQKLLEIKSKKK